MDRLTEQDVLLTLKEAEQYLRVSRATIYRLVYSGQLVGHKVGRRWRFYKTDVRKLLHLAGTSQPAHVDRMGS
ncbi:MAG: helix-turn-helix domain-containing protein [Chloroflexi bacterium]|nr:helix-turn-helix domain-containing protein [Chloroflexota bacterium]